MTCYHHPVALKYYVLTGPTAAGKTALLLGAANAGDLLLLSADSRQVYRHMDVGTGKATAEERSRLTHRIVDVADPGEDFSAFRFMHEAAGALAEARETGKTPWICGGTGLYIRSLVERLAFGGAPRPGLRDAISSALERRSPRELAEALSLELPEPDNPVRVLRAAESACGASSSLRRQIYQSLELEAETLAADELAARSQQLPPEVTAELERWECGGIFVLDPGRVDLGSLILARVERMFSGGLIDEVARLRSLGFGDTAVVKDGIAYREAGAVLDGAMTLEDAVERAMVRTRRYAKRQRTYFRGQGWKIASAEEVLAAVDDVSS